MSYCGVSFDGRPEVNDATWDLGTTRRYYNDFGGWYGFHWAYWAGWNRGGCGRLDNGTYRMDREDWRNGSHWLHGGYGHNGHDGPNW